MGIHRHPDVHPQSSPRRLAYDGSDGARRMGTQRSKQQHTRTLRRLNGESAVWTPPTSHSYTSLVQGIGRSLTIELQNGPPIAAVAGSRGLASGNERRSPCRDRGAGRYGRCGGPYDLDHGPIGFSIRFERPR